MSKPGFDEYDEMDPPPPPWWQGPLTTFVFIALLLGLIFALSGCSCRIECGPDVSAALRVIRIIAEK